MKKALIVLLAIVCFSCKNESKEEKKELTTAEKIAEAHGIYNWNKVSEISFTFNVDSGEKHFERSWIWKPKSQDVTLLTANDTITFNRKKIDSLTKGPDSKFINDKFWLLAPYQLVWDKGTTITDSINSIAPISKANLNKLTLTYGNEGGYTPGDAYDFFYDKNYLIKEWVFRKGNTKKPFMITTFENYEDFKGIKIAKDHKKLNDDWNLYFTNISIKKD